VSDLNDSDILLNEHKGREVMFNVPGRKKPCCMGVRYSNRMKVYYDLYGCTLTASVV
jgi:hypothetical protein